MHSNDCVHQDVKAEHILLDENGTVKLVDFGMSMMVDEESVYTEVCGTVHYVSTGDTLCTQSLSKSILFLSVHPRDSFNSPLLVHYLMTDDLIAYSDPARSNAAAQSVRFEET